jgi:Phosphotransferase enzyme family
MTTPVPLRGGFEESEMYDVLRRACAGAGLDGTGAELLRGHTNAVVRLRHAPIVVKIARRGTRPESVERTVDFVRWLMERDFPTVPLHPVPHQPALVDGHAVTFWTYLPQTSAPIAAVDLAEPLRLLHSLPAPPVPLRRLDNLGAIRSSLAAIATLPPDELDFLTQQADRLQDALKTVDYLLPETVVQGDPQHRNALRDGSRTVLCDWDTVAVGNPEWDLATVEIHCRRFRYGAEHYRAFADAYGFDVTTWPGYSVLRDIRELRMITTNARKALHTPGTLSEVRQRIAGLREGAHGLPWNIL